MIPGPGVTVKLIPLLARPAVVTTTLPVVAPAGTGVMIEVGPHDCGVALVPLNVRVPELEDPRLVPVTVTSSPTGPEVVDKLVMVPGATVNRRESA